jgi:hypothetical protein
MSQDQRLISIISTMKQPSMTKITCSPCRQVFNTNEEYLSHKCPKADGFTPRDPEYVIKTTCPNFAKISQSALKRGLEKKIAK